jgi:hypothetical protein
MSKVLKIYIYFYLKVKLLKYQRIKKNSKVKLDPREVDMSVNPAVRTLRQEDHVFLVRLSYKSEFKSSLSYIVRLCLK